MIVNNDIAIVGGGISGLYMAWLILSQDKSKKKTVTVYEKSDRWGGRIDTVQMSDGTLIEGGAGRFNSYHTNLIRLIKKLGLWDKTYLLSEDKKHYIKNNIFRRKIDTSDISSWVVQKARAYPASHLKAISLEMFCHEIMNTPEDVEDYIGAFAYNSFFETMNAYDSLHELTKNLRGNDRFWIMKGGLSQIVDRLVKELEIDDRFKGHLGTGVVSYDSARNELVFQNEQKKQYGKVMFALTKPQLLGVNGLLESDVDLQKSLDSVYDTPLHRIYARFPLDEKTGRAWFHYMEKVTTNNPLRYVIPISPENGVIMISYTDGKYALMWNDIKKTGLGALQSQIMIHVRKLFPNFDIPDPIWMSSSHWNTGVHYWGPHAIKYKNKRSNGHVVFGEVFSKKNQGWIEGSLDSCLVAYKDVFS